ncbi:unnamed protein product [[Candida] boidinii]|nr:unnamed protein product [[Candida] boidinii]
MVIKQEQPQHDLASLPDKSSTNSNSNSNSTSTSTSNSTANTNTNENASSERETSLDESLRLIEDLKVFLITAPANWHENQVIRRYFLNREEGFVSCVFWNNLYYITGTDIVRCIAYKFHHYGRKIIDRKKFEEGIFSDLRSLKCGTDAVLENPRSDFLKFLHKNQCLRTQKKQKVFFWFNVPHDKLFADALERDLKKETSGSKGTTAAEFEPSLSFKYDSTKSLLEQINNDPSMHWSGYNSNSQSSSNRDPASMPSSAISNGFSHGLSTDDDFPLDYLPENANVVTINGVATATAGAAFQNNPQIQQLQQQRPQFTPSGVQFIQTPLDSYISFANSATYPTFQLDPTLMTNSPSTE